MKHYRMDNTEGFSQEQLDDMNSLYENIIATFDKNSKNYENKCQHYSELILENYVVEAK